MYYIRFTLEIICKGGILVIKNKSVVLLISILIYIASSALLLAPGRSIIGNPLYLVAICGMFGSMIALWRVLNKSRLFYFILSISIIVRIFAVVQFPEGDDIYRYIWEGRIQHEGFNPFELSPDSEELAHLRDNLWQEINHKHIPTIYWPFAQLIFKITARISHSIIFFKSVFVLFDLLTLLIIFLLVRFFCIERRHIFLYALNPLVIVYIAGEGHLESIMVFWIILSLYFLQRGRYGLMYLAFGFALMTKCTPIVFLLFLIRRNNFKYLFMLIIPCLLTLLYVQQNISLFGVPKLFALEFRFNGLFYSLVNNFYSDNIAAIISLILSLSLGLGVILLTPDPFRAVSLAAGILLICTPILHPWYLILMTPFLVFYRSWPWLILHLTILPIIFFFELELPETSFWRNNVILMSIEYIPFIVFGLWWIFKYKRHWPVIYKDPQTISIIIPVLNEEKNISPCLESLRGQKMVSEVLIIDGGSIDNTKEIAQSLAFAKILTSEPGRGLQIKEGINHSTGDIIVILHADSRLRANALERLFMSLKQNPDAAGGSISAQYENNDLPFRFAELLNNLRALWTGISFGDQAQFFRKEVIGNSFPPYKLMEDIELSFRIKEKGALLFLPRGVMSSTRGWLQRGYLNNFFKVIFLSFLFVIMRKLALIKDNCEWFYRVYYGTE